MVLENGTHRTMSNDQNQEMNLPRSRFLTYRARSGFTSRRHFLLRAKENPSFVDFQVSCLLGVLAAWDSPPVFVFHDPGTGEDHRTVMLEAVSEFGCVTCVVHSCRTVTAATLRSLCIAWGQMGCHITRGSEVSFDVGKGGCRPL